MAALSGGGFASPDSPGEASVLSLNSGAIVDGEGIYLGDVASDECESLLPRVRLGDSPALGQSVTLSRAQVAEVLQKAAPELTISNSIGAESVRVTRRARALHESDLRDLLTATLQRDYVQDKGELELRFTRPWKTATVPDDSIRIRVLELPTAGVTAHFILRFELHTDREVIGSWQIPVQARVWREVWVARSPLKRGDILSQVDRAKERRDVLAARDAFLGNVADETAFELAQDVPAGVPIYARAVQMRKLVRRGQVVEAYVQEGALSLSLKVEVLEDGALGQQVRVRNPQSKREFRGKVHGEQIILVSL
jgi:flagella basal body P-ring formation protein FlgA